MNPQHTLDGKRTLNTLSIFGTKTDILTTTEAPTEEGLDHDHSRRQLPYDTFLDCLRDHARAVGKNGARRRKAAMERFRQAGGVWADTLDDMLRGDDDDAHEHYNRKRLK